MKGRSLRSAALGVVLLLVAAACGGNDSDGGNGDVGNASGSIEVSGSSTVEPITARVAEAFQAANPGIGISVEGPGTGDGFVRFCSGETDISDASRPIKEAEIETCAANGVNWIELHIATDGIAVITSHENDAVQCLDFADLYALIGPESEGTDTWADNNALAAEIGAGHDPYPDEPLVITAPGEESGTFDTFVELALEDIGEERLGDDFSSNPTRADYEASANDAVIVNGVSGNVTSLGWVGYAFYAENTDVLRAIEIDGGAGCVAPSEATIASFEYPFARPLYIYVNTDKGTPGSTLADFVDYFLSEEGLAAVTDAGYVQLPADDVSITRASWEAEK